MSSATPTVAAASMSKKSSSASSISRRHNRDVDFDKTSRRRNRDVDFDKIYKIIMAQGDDNEMNRKVPDGHSDLNRVPGDGANKTGSTSATVIWQKIYHNTPPSSCEQSYFPHTETNIPKEEVHGLLKQMKEDIENEFVYNVLNNGEKALCVIEDSEECFSDPSYYCALVYSLMCRAYEIKDDYNTAVYKWCTRLRELAIDTASMSIHIKLRLCVARIHAHFKNHERAIKIWHSILPFVKEVEDKFQLTYDLANCYKDFNSVTS